MKSILLTQYDRDYEACHRDRDFMCPEFFNLLFKDVLPKRGQVMVAAHYSRKNPKKKGWKKITIETDGGVAEVSISGRKYDEIEFYDALLDWVMCNFPAIAFGKITFWFKPELMEG
jgi:hypothetical protein